MRRAASCARVAASLAGVLWSSGCGSEGASPLDAGAADAAVGDDAAAQPSAGCGASGETSYPAGTTTVGNLTHDGRIRTFRVHLPPGYDGAAPVALVLMFHGAGSTAQKIEQSTGWSPIADREGFAVVYPNGTGQSQTWNGGGCCGGAANSEVDDVGFTAAMLDHLEAELCIDRRRVFASGMSNGAIMTHRLGCELSARFAAIAPVSGPEMSPTCTPAHDVAVLHTHGTADGIVPFGGGDGCGDNATFPSVPATMERRRVLNRCDATTTHLFDQGDGECTGYDHCDDGADVVLCRIVGGGHSWPGGSASESLAPCPTDGDQSTTFVASEVIWRFFSAHGRDAP